MDAVTRRDEQQTARDVVVATIRRICAELTEEGNHWVSRQMLARRLEEELSIKPSTAKNCIDSIDWREKLRVGLRARGNLAMREFLRDTYNALAATTVVVTDEMIAIEVARRVRAPVARVKEVLAGNRLLSCVSKDIVKKREGQRAHDLVRERVAKTITSLPTNERTCANIATRLRMKIWQLRSFLYQDDRLARLVVDA